MFKTPFRDALFETLKENPECQKGLRAAAEKLVRERDATKKKLGLKMLVILDPMAGERS
jgi:hypothetical protein